MTEPIIIEKQELIEIINTAVFQAQRQLLSELTGRKPEPWITQNQATKLLGKGGRGKLEKAMARGQVRFHKRNPETKLGRVMVRTEDVDKLRNKPE